MKTENEQNKQNKNKHFNFRVNEKEYNAIKTKIEKSKLNTSEYLLRTAMYKDIIVIDGLEEIIINVNLEDIKEEMKNIWQLLNLLIQKQS